MAVIDSAVDGLAGAVVSGMFGALAIAWTRKSRRQQLEDAWQKQADELATRLSKQYEREISYLRKESERKEAEIRRLNRLLNRRSDD